MNVSFFEIKIAYAALFGKDMPMDLPFVKAADQIKAADSGWPWLFEQAALMQNAKLSYEEAVSVLKGRIANESAGWEDPAAAPVGESPAMSEDEAEEEIVPRRKQ